MAAVGKWTGRHATALRLAMRMTHEAFADYLGASVRTVKYWSSGPRSIPREAMQEALDTTLDRISDQAKNKFTLLLNEPSEATTGDELAYRGSSEQLEVAKLDWHVVDMLEAQTEQYRLMDRTVGAAIVPQSVAHVEHMQTLLRTALPGKYQPHAAVALAEGAALAGWQTLDAGDAVGAWNLHDVAKSAAWQGDNPSVLAHVTAQQAYALLDAARTSEGLEVIQHVNTSATRRRIPRRLQAWLAAAEAEFQAAAGHEYTARRMLERADSLLPKGENEPELPYLMLNETHLARWRGHCLARLGANEAVQSLAAAVSGGGSLQSRRAEAGLRVDLALALRKQGDLDESKTEAQKAADLAGSTGSARQRARIVRLLVN